MYHLAMREPDFLIDGWCLEDGEERNAEAPVTFRIPDAARRSHLRPGDLAKLIFRIAVDDEDDGMSVERMWVIVREVIPSGYLGVLDNEPGAIVENDELWLGTELPFQPRHVIDIGQRTPKTVALADEQPRRRWR